MDEILQDGVRVFFIDTEVGEFFLKPVGEEGSHDDDESVGWFGLFLFVYFLLKRLVIDYMPQFLFFQLLLFHWTEFIHKTIIIDLDV